MAERYRTSALRRLWAPACELANPTTMTLHGGGRIHVDGRTVPVWEQVDQLLQKHGYKTDKSHTGAYNCLGGDTLVVTRDGWRPIRDLVGEDVELLTTTPGHGGPGRWVTAPVRSFGVQATLRVVVERYGVQRTIVATADHRWFARREGGPVTELTTAELEARDGRRGHRLVSCRPQSVASRTNPSPVGVMAGLVFGDGTTTPYGSRAYLVGEKDDVLRRFFPMSPTGDDEVRIYDGLPRSWKDRAPALDEGSAHLYGWLAGYFAADGRVSEQGTVELSSADEWRLEAAREVALRLGIASSPITSVKRSGYGDEPTLLFALPLDPRTLDSSFFLLPDHRERWNGDTRKRPPDWSVVAVEPNGDEEVFCATVEGTEAFVIEDFVLTGNCRRITGGTGFSLHAYGIAVDVNWRDNGFRSRNPNPGDHAANLAQGFTDFPVALIEDLRTITLADGTPVLSLGTDWTRPYDAMHWQVVVSPKDLANQGLAPLEEPPKRRYAQAVVGFSDTDLRHGGVLAATYDMALVKVDADGNLRSMTHAGDVCEVTDWAALVGGASVQSYRGASAVEPLAGQRDVDTAREVGVFINGHPLETRSRRGVPWTPPAADGPAPPTDASSVPPLADEPELPADVAAAPPAAVETEVPPPGDAADAADGDDSDGDE